MLTSVDNAFFFEGSMEEFGEWDAEKNALFCLSRAVGVQSELYVYDDVGGSNVFDSSEKMRLGWTASVSLADPLNPLGDSGVYGCVMNHAGQNTSRGVLQVGRSWDTDLVQEDVIDYGLGVMDDYVLQMGFYTVNLLLLGGVSEKVFSIVSNLISSKPNLRNILKVWH